jgi:hypothetical protein
MNFFKKFVAKILFDNVNSKDTNGDNHYFNISFHAWAQIQLAKQASSCIGFVST